MISALQIYEDLSQTLDDKAARRIAHYLDAVYQDLQQTATKSDIAEVRTAIRDLTQAQQRTEAALADLAQTELATQTRVGELAQAQERTELRVAELAQAQQRTEAAVAELAQAQRRTEVALAALTEVVKENRAELKQTRDDLGGLAHTVGYRLEDDAYRALPRLLQRDYGIELTGRLLRRHLPLRAGGHIELNILGPAMREGRPIHIVGEARSQLHRRDVRHFLEKTLELTRAELGEVFPVLVTLMTPEVGLDDFIRQQGIALYYSFDFP